LRTDEEQDKFRELVVALEKMASYPLGKDKFKIDHGPDYFAFFKRLGEVDYCVVHERAAPEKLIAVGAGVLRVVPLPQKGTTTVQPSKVWYFADLKVRPSHRGRWLPSRMLGKSFYYGIQKSSIGYGITMNPPPWNAETNTNPMLKVISHFKLANIGVGNILYFWSLSKNEILKVQALLEKHRGPICFLSLQKIKDIVLESTEKPMPLWHVQWKPLGIFTVEKGEEKRNGVVSVAPLDDGIHMFCVTKDDPLTHELIEKYKFEPSGSATILHKGMKQCDWKFVLTSDI